MTHTRQTALIVRFGPYEMDRRACALRREGTRIPLQIQPFRVLEALVDRAGEVVTRAELRAEIWPSEVYVDFDHGLNNAVNRLRQALGDSAESPRFIETLPRIGYRFVYAIERQAEGLPAAGAETTVAGPRRVPTRAVVAASAGLAFAAIGALALNAAWQPRSTSDRGDVSLPSTQDAEAQDAYLRGLVLFERRNKEAITRSIEYLTEATTRDPNFAEAYAALAEAYVTAGGPTLVRTMTREEAAPLAMRAAQESLRLQPDLPEGHSAMASVLDKLEAWSPERDAQIEAEYWQAVALGPTAARVYLFFGNFLSSRGRSDEAIPQYRRALEREPLSPSVNSRLGAELVAVGEIESGMQYLQRTIELDPYQYNARVRFGWSYAGLGELDDARQQFARAEEISPGSLPSLTGLAFVAALRGESESASEALDTLIPLAVAASDPYSIAMVYVALGDRDNALTWLLPAAREPRNLTRQGPFGIDSTIYDFIRDDPRFREVERIVREHSGAAQPVALAD
jgi:DNA-binding winged helix-turn-helix (wHTH) protein/Tfp pilus assembly protein PilF